MFELNDFHSSAMLAIVRKHIIVHYNSKQNNYIENAISLYELCFLAFVMIEAVYSNQFIKEVKPNVASGKLCKFSDWLWITYITCIILLSVL